MTTDLLNKMADRITAYLSGGGLFNPELANHEAVRDLLIECRDAFKAQPSGDEWKPLELLAGLHPELTTDDPRQQALAIFDHVQSERAEHQRSVASFENTIGLMQKMLAARIPADRKLLEALDKYIHPVLQELQYERGTNSLAAHNLRLCSIEVAKALRGERDTDTIPGVGFPLSGITATEAPATAKETK
jgi:hypothetical protein